MVLAYSILAIVRLLRFLMMDQTRGSTLTGNVLAFGLVTLCFVTFRISYRFHTKKLSTSDWFLLFALVCHDLSLSISSGEDDKLWLANFRPQRLRALTDLIALSGCF